MRDDAYEYGWLRSYLVIRPEIDLDCDAKLATIYPSDDG